MQRGALEIQAELAAMPEWKRLVRVRRFAASIRLLEQNGAELERLLRFLVEDPRSVSLVALDRRAHLDAAMEEAIRLLHNYVAAVLSLVDHSRVLYEGIYAADGRFPEYQEEVDRRFAHDPLAQFVKCLRHYAQHCQLPVASFVIHMDQVQGMRRSLVLNREELLATDCWNTAAKKYLQTAPAQLDVLGFVVDYTKAVRSFYTWMSTRLAGIHRDDLAAVEAKQGEICRAVAPEMPAKIEVGLRILGQGIGRLPDVFAFALSPEEYARLAPLEANIEKWLDECLAIVQARFGALPACLVERLHQTARTSAARLAAPRVGGEEG